MKLHLTEHVQHSKKAQTKVDQINNNIKTDNVK